MYENANIDIGRDLSNFMDIMMRTPSGSRIRIKDQDNGSRSGSMICIKIKDQDSGSRIWTKIKDEDQG